MLKNNPVFLSLILHTIIRHGDILTVDCENVLLSGSVFNLLKCFQTQLVSALIIATYEKHVSLLLYHITKSVLNEFNTVQFFEFNEILQIFASMQPFDKERQTTLLNTFLPYDFPSYPWIKYFVSDHHSNFCSGDVKVFK